MFKKYSIFIVVLFILSLTFIVTSSVLAKSDKKQDVEIDGVLPEEEGVYNIKDHPNMKLRVFVYRVKSKPNPTPTLACSLPDTNSNAIVNGAGWKLPATWTYRLNTSSVPSSVGSINLPLIASNAYGVWQNVAEGQVSFIKGSDTTVNKAQYDGQNIITWGRASGSSLAVSYIWYSSGIATEVDTIMNNRFSWKWSNPDTWTTTPAGTTCAYQGVYDAQNILTHELGHTMGLDDEYTDDFQDNTMYGYGSTTETKKDSLTAGDILGIQNLY